MDEGMEANAPMLTKMDGDIERLACPVCRRRLAVADEGIRCVGCGRVYPVLDGIPVLIANRAAGA